MNLILVGRDLDKLEKLANLIQSKYQVHVELIKVDFSSHSDFSEEIKQVIKDKDIGILVNNVGVILPHPMYFHEVHNF